MVYQCVGQRASSPFHMKGAGLGIYSLEELLFYIRENVFMIDSSLMSEEFVKFVRCELCLSSLADKLAEIMNNDGDLSAFVECLFKASDFVSGTELVTILGALAVTDRLSSHEKHKIRGDFLMKCGHTSRAVMEYYSALQDMDRNSMPEESARLCNNIGVGCAEMFLFSRAADYFEESYRLKPDEETETELLVARKLSLSDDEYEKYLAGRGVSKETAVKVEQLLKHAETKVIRRRDARMVRNAENRRKNGDSFGESKVLSEVLELWKNEYRRI